MCGLCCSRLPKCFFISRLTEFCTLCSLRGGDGGIGWLDFFEEPGLCKFKILGYIRKGRSQTFDLFSENRTNCKLKVSVVA